MSQRNVERVIGLLATDERLREKFTKDPGTTLSEMSGDGIELTPTEMRSLSHLDPGELARFAATVDPRLQRTSLGGGVW